MISSLEEGGLVALRRNGARSFNYGAIVVGSDKANDLALLKIVNMRPDAEPWKLAGRPIESADADNVVAIGGRLMHLGIPQKSVTAALGDVEAVGPARSLWAGLPEKAPTGEVVKSTAPVQRGMSGGPVFDAQNRLVGFNSFSATDSNTMLSAMFPKTAVTVTKHLTTLLDKL